LSYYENGQWEDAVNHYQKAISSEPSAVHYNNRGLAQYHQGKLSDAKDDYDKALELDPNDATIYYNRGNVYLNWEPQPDFEAAHRDYDTAL